MSTIAIRESSKKLTAFRLDSELIDRLKMLAKRDNRSLNNFVETVLFDVAYNESNDETVTAIKEARENVNLEDFDFEAFKKYVASLK